MDIFDILNDVDHKEQEEEYYQKYNSKLSSIQLYINNPYIFNMFQNHGVTIDGTFIELLSNINTYEACFISILTHIYSTTHPERINVLEVGCANGISSIIIANSIIGLPNRSFDMIDPFQTTKWNFNGLKNIRNYLQSVNYKMDIRLYDEMSQTIMPTMVKKYNIILIDSNHEEESFFQDCINSNLLLVDMGLMILDDVLHPTVRRGLLRFLALHSYYERIHIQHNKLVTDNRLYPTDIQKKDVFNPATMYCFRKNKSLLELQKSPKHIQEKKHSIKSK